MENAIGKGIIYSCAMAHAPLLTKSFGISTKTKHTFATEAVCPDLNHAMVSVFMTNYFCATESAKKIAQMIAQKMILFTTMAHG